ncbi:hypothetical protein O181_059438 [Austropuccinia psidii MF-1]|uniref:Uncharacterized protein n=1 Tax=Austropuccinia psidii MF-1 TaxID=1389203 RepID=A0A9Q3EEU3_9BASI|nr:hypothetical protein [Austropuccinia psidii MF-1]
MHPSSKFSSHSLNWNYFQLNHNQSLSIIHTPTQTDPIHASPYSDLNSPISRPSSSNDIKNLNPLRKTRVIRPRHPILITGDFNSTKILPYSRLPVALLIENNTISFYSALIDENHEEWKESIDKELNSMTKLKVW